MAKRKEQILVIKLSALGDFIQALGPMKAIRAEHDKAHITLLTTKPFEAFAKKAGYADTVIVDKRPKWYQIKDWVNLRKALNKKVYDHVYDLQNNDRVKFYKELLKPGFQWHSIIDKSERKEHAGTRHQKILKRAGIKKRVTPDTLTWAGKDLDFKTLKLPKKFALFVPGCAPQHPYKRWPATYYGQLARSLYEDHKITPVILGTKAEESEAFTIKEECPESISLIGRTKLFDIPALARKALFAVGNDTGPMHMIGPTNCKSLVVFSHASDPERHAPMGKHVETLREENLTNLLPSVVLDKLENWIQDGKAK